MSLENANEPALRSEKAGLHQAYIDQLLLRVMQGQIGTTPRSERILSQAAEALLVPEDMRGGRNLPVGNGDFYQS